MQIIKRTSRGLSTVIGTAISVSKSASVAPLPLPPHHYQEQGTVADSRYLASMRDPLLSPQLQGHRLGCPTLLNTTFNSNAKARKLAWKYLRTLQCYSSSSNYYSENHRGVSSCFYLDRTVFSKSRAVLRHNSKKGVRSIGLHGASDESDVDSAQAFEENGGSREPGMEESESESECDGSEKKEKRWEQSRVVVRVQQRRKETGSVDLLTVPGIGPRNMQKLVDKGIAKVAELKQLYREKFLGDTSEKMVDFLRNSIGIVHKNHAERITSYIKESVDEELKEEIFQGNEKIPRRKRLTFCVEGNISVGKTTFLQRVANETFELRDLVEVVPEPIYKWQNIGPDHFNILDAFYAEPKRYAYTFQNYVFVTRVMQERESAGGLKPLRLMERSVFTDRMVFVRAVHEAKWMNEMELSIYDSWFDPVVSVLPGLIPDGFIYLRASPDTCHRRLQLRKRAEENSVSLEYLQGLHEKHENWLFPAQCGNHGVLSVSQLPHEMDSMLHSDIRDRVFFLQGEHVHASIQKVPALVLDCEPNIDFSQDVEAKQEYARQVAEFFEFVKRKNEFQTQDKNQDDRNLKKLIVPQKGGLLGPDGKFLQPSQLNSLEFCESAYFPN